MAMFCDIMTIQTLSDFHQRFKTEHDCAEWLFQVKWPNGFECGACHHQTFYHITSRRLPLFQCKACGRQHSLLEGTVMENSRTDLRKWFLAIWFTSDLSRTKNAVQLKDILNVTYKTAWRMLAKLRAVLSLANQQIQLKRTVHISTGMYGRPYNPTTLRHRQEHPLLVGVAVDENGKPEHVQIKKLPSEHLRNRLLTPLGKKVFLEKYIYPGTEDIRFTLGRFKEWKSPITYRFVKSAAKWINDVFKGIGPKYLQHYLDTFCYCQHLRFSNQPAYSRLVQLCANTTLASLG